MKTAASHISDIELRLSGAKPSQDLDIDRRQIRKWLDDAYSDIIIQQMKAEGGEISGACYLWFYNVDVLIEEAGNPECQRYYCYLPASPLEFDEGQGIKLVETTGGKELKRMRPKDTQVFKHLRFLQADASYYRVSGRLMLEVSKAYMKNPAKINILMAVSPSAGDVPDDVPYPCPTNLVSMLIDKATAIGLKQLQVPQDLVADGKQN